MRLRCFLLFPLLMFSSIRAFAEQPSVRIILFTPSDRDAPAGARHRLTQIADAADRFFFTEMNRWGYPPAVRTLFRREPDGSVEVLNVKGDKPAKSGKYDKEDCVDGIVNTAFRQYKLAGQYIAWWIFIYLGDRPTRFADWHGSGNPVEGGWAVVKVRCKSESGWSMDGRHAAFGTSGRAVQRSSF